MAKSVNQDPATLGLKRIDQPPAFGKYLGSVWNVREFIFRYGVAKIKGGAAGNNLGLVWEVLDPLLLSIAYYLVFGLLLGTERDSSNFPLFLIAGVMTWKLFQSTLINTAKSLSRGREQDIVHSSTIPQIAIPIATAVQWSIKSLPVMLLLYPASLLLGAPISAQWILLPLVFALTSFSAFSIGLMVVRLVSRIPDLLNLIHITMRMMFFMTGVFFSVDIRFADAPEWIQTIVVHNPSAVVLNLSRAVFLDDITITTGQVFWLIGLCIALFLIGSFNFWRDESKHG
jgi:teichoic acid transport system permease protein